MIMPAARILDFSEIPVIDIGPLVHGESQREAGTVDAIARACQDVGFMYVRNHDVPSVALSRLVEQAKLFFALPTDKKKSVAVENSPQFRGYLPLEYTGNEGEKGKNLQEGFMIMRERPLDSFPMHGPNQWPSALPSLRSAMLDYFVAMENLAAPLMHGIALALGQDRDCFDSFHRDPMSVLKLNHYPPQEIRTKPRSSVSVGIVMAAASRSCGRIHSEGWRSATRAAIGSACRPSTAPS
jgi:isopenicillin N synthase-like dioxygenase